MRSSSNSQILSRVPLNYVWASEHKTLALRSVFVAMCKFWTPHPGTATDTVLCARSQAAPLSLSEL